MRCVQRLDELEALMSAESSYKAYRAEILKSAPPIIPYMYVGVVRAGRRVRSCTVAARSVWVIAGRPRWCARAYAVRACDPARLVAPPRPHQWYGSRSLHVRSAPAVPCGLMFVRTHPPRRRVGGWVGDAGRPQAFTWRT